MQPAHEDLMCTFRIIPPLLVIVIETSLWSRSWVQSISKQLKHNRAWLIVNLPIYKLLIMIDCKPVTKIHRKFRMCYIKHGKAGTFHILKFSLFLFKLYMNLISRESSHAHAFEVSSCAYISYLVLFHHPLCMHDTCAHSCKVNFTPKLSGTCWPLLFRCVHQIVKVTRSFVMSVCLSNCMEQLSSHWTDIHEICYLRIFRKSVKKIQVSLKSDKNKG
jgi:hypothetical protein